MSAKPRESPLVLSRADAARNKARRGRGLPQSRKLPPSLTTPASPPLATAGALARARWRRCPQNKSQVAAACLRRPACNGARAQQGLGWHNGLLTARLRHRSQPHASLPLATAGAVARARWRRCPQHKSQVAAACLRRPACNGARAQQSLWWFKGLLSARRRCRTEPASSYSERRSSSPLAPPPTKQVPGGFSMLTATCMEPGKITVPSLTTPRQPQPLQSTE